MKTKKEILDALAHSDEDRLLLAGVLDKIETCRERGYLTHTRFLGLRERALGLEAARLAGASAFTTVFGGYADAERAVLLFYPDYMDADSAVQSAPIVLLRATKSPNDTLSHRDYLGSLMGLRIDRSMVGDILVHQLGADILVLEEMADFLQLNYGKAGRKTVSVSREPLENVMAAEVEQKSGTGSVASPRVDGIIALVFGLSRAEAQSQISRGLVFLNDAPCTKGEREVREGDRLTVRGMGRAKITEFGGTSRKGRQFLSFTRTR